MRGVATNARIAIAATAASLGCSIAPEDQTPDFSGDADSAPNETFDTGDTGGDATGDGDGATGDGAGDGTSGDGDGTSGDGDGTSGDGDGTSGDGDGTSGDGDGTSGDGTSGDGDGTSGDGTTGDGDGTSGDGDGYAHTIVIDGVDDFTPEESATTSTFGFEGHIAWDADFVYFGMQGPDIGGGNGQVFWVIYLGTGAPGSTVGETYGSQQPALSFDAAVHLRWKADDSFTDAMQWTGMQWQSAPGWFAPGDVFRGGDFVELRVARAVLGDPAVLDVHMGMINEMAGGEWSWAAFPAASHVDGLDPDYGMRYAFDLSGALPPAGHTPI